MKIVLAKILQFVKLLQSSVGQSYKVCLHSILSLSYSSVSFPNRNIRVSFCYKDYGLTFLEADAAAIVVTLSWN